MRALLLLLVASTAYAVGDPVGTSTATFGWSTSQGGGGAGNPGLTSLIMGGPSSTMGAPVQSYANILRETATYTQQIQSYRAQSARIEQILAAQRQEAASQPSLQQLISSTQVDTQTRITNVQDQWLARKVVDSQSKVTGDIIATFPVQGGELREEFSTWTTFSLDRKKVLILSDQYAEATQRFRTSLGAINPNVYPYSEIALEAGLTSLIETARIAGGGVGSFTDSFAESTAMLDIAKGLLDVGLSFTPGVSVGKDAYEALTGKSLIDGADLDFTSRSFAVLGVTTAGGSNILKGAFKGLTKIAELAHAKSLLGHGFESVYKIVDFAGRLGIRDGGGLNSFSNFYRRVMGSAGGSVERVERIIESARNVNPTLGNKHVRELPDLTGTFKEAFEGHIFKGSYEPGEIVFQAQRTGQVRPGNWFAPVKPINAQHADELLNIRVWGNDASQIKVFKINERVSGYAGKVAGGEGHQFFIPRDVPLEEVIEEIIF